MKQVSIDFYLLDTLVILAQAEVWRRKQDNLDITGLQSAIDAAVEILKINS